jgi:hypothetical protein
MTPALLQRSARFAMTKSKKKLPSKVQAVKAIARATVGTPPPERVLPDPKKKRASTRSKPSLAQLLTPDVHEGDPR